MKYNNLMVLLVLGFFVLGGGVFAQTETGQDMIGRQTTSVKGVDNTLLLAADLEYLQMDFKIEKIEQDEKYYYVTYTFLDLVSKDSVWQYQLQERVLKLSLVSDQELSQRIAKELQDVHDDRIRSLQAEKEKAAVVGVEKRVQVTEYNGLIGGVLDVASKSFPGFEAVKKREIPSPDISTLLLLGASSTVSGEVTVDNLSDVYNEYVNQNDPDRDNIFGQLDNCPNVANADQLDSNNNGIGDACEGVAITPGAEQLLVGTTTEVMATTSSEEGDVQVVDLEESANPQPQ